MNILPENIMKNCLEMPGKFVTQFEQPAGKANTFIEKCLSCYFPWDCLTFSFFSPRLYNICFFANEQKYLSKKIQDKFYVIHISIKLQSFNNNTSGFLMLNFQMIATKRWKVSDVFSFTKQIFIHEKERWWWKDIIQMYAFFTIPMMNMYPGSGRPINSLLYII